METQKIKQPNQTATAKTTEKTREQDTTELLRRKAGYGQHTSP